MIWLAFAKRYWKLAAILAVVGFFFFALNRAIGRAEQAGYERATADMAQRVAKANAATAALEQRQRVQSRQAEQSWESQRNDLQSQVDRLLTVTRPAIRVCRPASAAPVPGVAAATGSFDDPAAETIDALPAGRDLGPELVQFGGECERYRRQLIELQGWISATR